MKLGSEETSVAGKSENTGSVPGQLQSQPNTDIAAKFYPGLVWTAVVLVWFGAPAQPQGRAKATFFPQRADQALMG